MILPYDMKPELSLYCVGGRLLEEIPLSGEILLSDLFQNTMAKHENYTAPLLIYGLDWLFLLTAISVRERGDEVYVSRKVKSI